MNINNYVESQYRRLNDNINEEYIDLYQQISHPQLQKIVATLHSRFVVLFRSMNDRLPTGDDYGAHFWAEPSRALIEVIDMSEGLQRSLKNTPLAFEFDDYYKGVITRCKEFLSGSGGSAIPPGMPKIDLYYTIPMFVLSNSIEISVANEKKYFDLKEIGQGSYAYVYKYFDEYYKKQFVLKRAKPDLDEKELIRFKREYEQMKALNSPYIIEVYCYDDDKNQYIMELMDMSLDEYISKSDPSTQQRKNICSQILRAFNYIHSNGLLHRDISPKNILIKQYDDVDVAKISDFGLVRIPNSTLTSVNTDYKGYFNDPELAVEGFNTYDIVHETYALTRIVYFVLTGKTNTTKIEDEQLRRFVTKGLSPDKNNRYRDVDELFEEFRKLK